MQVLTGLSFPNCAMGIKIALTLQGCPLDSIGLWCGKLTAWLILKAVSFLEGVRCEGHGCVYSNNQQWNCCRQRTSEKYIHLCGFQKKSQVSEGRSSWVFTFFVNECKFAGLLQQEILVWKCELTGVGSHFILVPAVSSSECWGDLSHLQLLKGRPH